jgi:sugar phosphate isomerase/epimerase
MTDYKTNVYKGADYGFDSSYDKEFSTGFKGYGMSPKFIGIVSDGRTANQLKSVFDKLNTGAKVIEVQGTQAPLLEAMPKQHFGELNRLRKLVGADLTFHGPIVEPTGVQENHWEEIMRERAERQMWGAVEKAHDLDPDGNVVVTFHSSNGLPPPEIKTKGKDGKDVISTIVAINEETGRVVPLPKSNPDFFAGDKEYKPENELNRINQERWSTQLSNINLSADRSRSVFSRIRDVQEKNPDLNVGELYKIQGKPEGKEYLNSLAPVAQRVAKSVVEEISYAEIMAKDSFRMFKDAFNEAYSDADKNGKDGVKRKLEEVKSEMAPAVKAYQKDSSKVEEFTEAVIDGIGALKGIEPPEYLKPIRKFAIDKASETFSNVAMESYKKFGDNSPIISIENPPAGGGLSRAEDLKQLIDASRKKFAEKLVKEEGVSSGEAKDQADKLIGATWDVGHINMIRGLGYSKEDVVKESEKIAKYVKHVHLSDNFGIEHTELPMGMGNVPTKEILELKKGFEKAKKIAETFNWFGPQGFGKNSPLMETFRAFDSPIYAMTAGPSWQAYSNTFGNYSSGFGRALPDQHFSIYGAGFASLPPELGGQMAGRSRLSGTPTE